MYMYMYVIVCIYIYIYVAQNMTVNAKNIKAPEAATMIPTFLVENSDNFQVVQLTFLDTDQYYLSYVITRHELPY